MKVTAMSRLIVPPNIIGTPKADTVERTTTEFNDIGIQVNFNGQWSGKVW